MKGINQWRGQALQTWKMSLIRTLMLLRGSNSDSVMYAVTAIGRSLAKRVNVREEVQAVLRREDDNESPAATQELSNNNDK